MLKLGRCRNRKEKISIWIFLQGFFRNVAIIKPFGQFDKNDRGGMNGDYDGKSSL
jgi:hypothetical protein